MESEVVGKFDVSKAEQKYGNMRGNSTHNAACVTIQKRNMRGNQKLMTKLRKTPSKSLIEKSKDPTVGSTPRGALCLTDLEAIKNGRVFAYGLDVYNGEPKIHPEYLKLKNIFLLPHLGSATKRTRWDMAYRATKNLEDFFSGKKPQDQVN